MTATDEHTGYVQRESSGADAEVLLFEKLGKPVFHDFYDLLKWVDSLPEHAA
jgi:hypothetical protein